MAHTHTSSTRTTGSAASLRNRGERQTKLEAYLRAFRGLVQDSEDALIVLDPSCMIRFWNQGAEKMFGIPEEAALHHSINGVLKDYCKFSENNSLIGLCSPAKEKSRFLLLAQHRRQIIEVRLSPVADSDHFLWIGRDMTSFKEYEAQLVHDYKAATDIVPESERILLQVHQRLQYHLGNTPLGIIEWKGGHIIGWSKRAEEIFGWTAAEASGKTAEELHLVFENDPEVEEVRRQMLASNTLFERCILQNRTKKGAHIWCEWYGSVLRNETGGIASVLTFVEDITDRIAAEKKIRFNEYQLRLIYDSVSDVLFMLDVSGNSFRYASVNNSFLKANGCRSQDVLGKDIAEVIPQPELGLLLARCRTAVESRQSLRWEDVSACRSGVRTGVLTLTPVLDDAGMCIKLIGSLHDITDRVAAEKALRISEEKFATLFYSSPLPIYLMGKSDRVFKEVNDAFCSLTDYERRELLGKEYSLLFYDKDQLAGLWSALTQSGSVNDRVMQIVRKNGAVLQCLVSVQAIQLEGVPHYLITCLDITERLRTEAEYTKMYQLVQSSTNFISIVEESEGCRTEFINEAGKKLIGITDDNAAGKTEMQVTTKEEGERLLKLVEKNHGFLNAETVFIHQLTGRKIPVLLNVFPIVQGEKKLIAGIATDLTQIKQAESRVMEMNKQLHQLASHLQDVREEERMYIAREIHDELGQLLTAIKMDVFWAHTHLHKNPAGAGQRLSDSLQLLDNTLEAVRKIVAELHPALLQDLGLAEALRWYVQQFEQKNNIRVVLHFKGRFPAFEKKTELALFRICQEALTNIQKHAQATRVRITTSNSTGHFKITISDNGIGFDTGLPMNKKSLGLISMRERAMMCGGSVSFTAAPGKGTAIVASLPIGKPDPG